MNADFLNEPQRGYNGSDLNKILRLTQEHQEELALLSFVGNGS